jgi:hypothetical protein
MKEVKKEELMHKEEKYLPGRQDVDGIHEIVRGSIVRIEVLTFFQANPHTVDTASGIARRLHRPLKEVLEAMEMLARIGILERAENGRFSLFRLRHGDLIASFFTEQRSGQD